MLFAPLPGRLKNFRAPAVRFDSIADNLSKAGWNWGRV